MVGKSRIYTYLVFILTIIRTQLLIGIGSEDVKFKDYYKVLFAVTRQKLPNDDFRIL